jgi:hypothetical protein
LDSFLPPEALLLPMLALKRFMADVQLTKNDLQNLIDELIKTSEAVLQLGRKRTKDVLYNFNYASIKINKILKRYYLTELEVISRLGCSYDEHEGFKPRQATELRELWDKKVLLKRAARIYKNKTRYDPDGEANPAEYKMTFEEYLRLRDLCYPTEPDKDTRTPAKIRADALVESASPPKSKKP